MFILPIKATALGTMGYQSIEGCSKHAEILDVHAIEIKKTEESTNFAKCCGSFPVLDSVDFNRVHSNAILTDDNPKILHFRGFELTFLWFEIEVIVGEDLEDVIDDSSVQRKVIRGVNENIVHVNSDVALVDQFMENEVHH